MKKFSVVLIIALVTLTILSAGTSGARASRSKNGRAVMILIDRTTWADLDRTEPIGLSKLASRGASGLLINRTAKRVTTSARSYLTIGSGMRADVKGPTGYPINKDRFKALTAANKNTGYNARVGLPATLLRRHGVKIAAIGNADTIDSRNNRYLFGREVELIGVGEDGRPPQGDTSSAGVTSRSVLPGEHLQVGIVTDYERLQAAFDRYSSEKSLVIVETGDTRRADIAGPGLTEDKARAEKEKALGRADAFIDYVASRLDFQRDLLIVISPSPPLDKAGSPGEGLTPVIIAGPGFGRGLLTSPSTRRPALITSEDIAPTLAEFFGIDLGLKSSGRPVMSIPGQLSFSRTAKLADEYLLSERLATPIIVAYGLIEGTLIVLILIGFVFAEKWIDRSSMIWRDLTLFILAAPIGVFAAPLVPISFAGPGVYFSVILIIGLIITMAARLLPEKDLSPLIFITTATTLFIVVNLLIGAPADNRSAFGYTAISAGRFYGLGNHSLSTLVPASLTATLLWLKIKGRFNDPPRWALVLWFAFLVFIIGFGGLGANTGGIIMATPAFTLAYMGVIGVKSRRRRITAAIGTTITALLSLATIDALFPSEPTHLGLVTRLLYHGSLPAFAVVVKRKIVSNIGAFNYTFWSYIVVAVFFAFVIWKIVREREGLNWTAQRHPEAGLALTSGVIGGIIGTLVNDSGIAVLATVLGYLIVVMLYLELTDHTLRTRTLSD